MVESKEKYKIIVMAILLAGACYLTYYFHVVLETGTVFTHYFYIPIILAALWWRRKGLVVAIFLALLILFSHIFVREGVLTANDYFRVLMFIAIAFVVATLSEWIAKAQAKITHLNAVLRSIRNVNQLIVREKDRDRLIQRACENLIETRGYYSAWIALVDESHRFLTAAEAGLGVSFFQVVEMMNRGEFTRCGQKALKQSGIVVVEDVTAADCADCPLVGAYSCRAGMATRLEYSDRIYGILSVSIPAEMAIDADEQSLFNEVAGDIAFALRNLEQEEELMRHRDHLEKRVEERTRALRESEEKYGVMFETAKDAVFLSDETGRFVDVNQMACESLGYSKEELLKLSNREIDADPRGYEAFPKLRNGQEEQTTFEVNQQRKDGTLLPVEITGSFFTSGGQRLALAIARDISERKRAEEKLTKERDYTRHLIESSPDFQMTLDRNGRIMDVNEAFEHVVGKSREELIGSSIYEYLPKEGTEKAITKIFEQGKVRNIELTFNIQGKEALICNFSGTVFTTPEGKTGIYVTGRDITELKRAEDALKKEKNFSEKVIATVPDSLLVLDKDLRIKSVNRAFYKKFQTEPDEVIGSGIADILGDKNGKLSAALTQLFGTGDMLENFELHYQSEKLGERIFNITARGMLIAEEEEEEEELVVLEDITERKNAEEELRQSEKRFRTLIEKSQEAIFLLNFDMEFIFWNPAAEKLIGLTTPPKHKITLSDCLTPDSLMIAKANIAKAAETGTTQPHPYDLTVRKFNGTLIVVEIFMGLIQYEGKPHLLGTARDVTERKKAEEEVKKSHEFLAAIIDNIPDTITIRDPQHRFALVNQAYCNITGHTKEQVIGKTAYWKKDKAVFQTGKGLDITERFYTDLEGKRHCVSVKKAPLTDESGEVTHVVTISRDITKRKEIEDALRATYKELKTLDKLKTDFLNVAYHEMRSPLAPIVGYASLLERGELNEKQKKYVRVIEESATQLEELIESLLEVTRIEAGKVELTLESVSIPEIVDNVLERVKPQVEAKKQTISSVIPEGIEVEGDKQKITAIFDNLVSNAIKYTGENGKIDVVVEDRKKEEEIRVCVADTGVGIPEEQLHRVFERFYMVDNSLTRKGGLGLGLAIVKGYVKLHGGEVWVTSEPGKGSKFGFTLPKKQVIV